MTCLAKHARIHLGDVRRHPEAAGHAQRAPVLVRTHEALPAQALKGFRLALEDLSDARLAHECHGDLLTRLSADGPGITAGDLARIAVPTLVVGNDRDAVHPLSLAADLAGRIPGARLVTVTPKATSKPAHLADLAAALTAFLAALPRTLAP